ncbi:MAG: flagellar biosynthetic protein FliO [Desulfobacteraceae bacterium]|nr:flagellar biosynthetic protein FliO [Desulfobacteraceae bacterium]
MDQPDLTITALRLLFSLLFVLGVFALLFFGMKKLINRRTIGSDSQMIRVLSNSYVGVKKRISLVKIPGAVLVVGITNEHINLLTKIEDPALIETITTDENSKNIPSFARHLQKLSYGLKKKAP